MGPLTNSSQDACFWIRERVARAASACRACGSWSATSRTAPGACSREPYPKTLFIKNLMSTLVWSRGSLTKLIQFSGHFQNKFQTHQLRLSGGTTIKDLSYAAQRFDSTVRPLGRMVNRFEAFLHTAMDIVRERAPSKKEHQGLSLIHI